MGSVFVQSTNLSTAGSQAFNAQTDTGWARGEGRASTRKEGPRKVDHELCRSTSRSLSTSMLVDTNALWNAALNICSQQPGHGRECISAAPVTICERGARRRRMPSEPRLHTHTHVSQRAGGGLRRNPKKTTTKTSSAQGARWREVSLSTGRRFTDSASASVDQNTDEPRVRHSPENRQKRLTNNSRKQSIPESELHSIIQLLSPSAPRARTAETVPPPAGGCSPPRL